MLPTVGVRPASFEGPSMSVAFGDTVSRGSWNLVDSSVCPHMAAVRN